MQPKSIKVGDLVRMPYSDTYWWGNQIGIIDLVESESSGYATYRIHVPGKGYARFNVSTWVEILSEAR